MIAFVCKYYNISGTHCFDLSQSDIDAILLRDKRKPSQIFKEFGQPAPDLVPDKLAHDFLFDAGRLVHSSDLRPYVTSSGLCHSLNVDRQFVAKTPGISGGLKVGFVRT